MADLSIGCAVVFGATGGLGQAVARRMAVLGSNLVITYRKQPESLHPLIGELKSAGVKVSVTECDVTRLQSVREAFAAAQREYGIIHSVLNTVGLPYKESPLAELDEGLFRAVLEVDVIGFLNIAKAVIPIMRRQGAGSLVTVGTTAQERVHEGNSLSSIPKSTVAMMVRHLAAEEGKHGIRVNMVGAGVYNAGMALHDATVDDLDRQYSDTIALRRIGQAAEFAGAAAFMTTDAASYITGQVLQSDGGLSL